MNHHIINSNVYFVATGRDTPAMFYLFKGTIKEKSNKENYYTICNCECLENENIIRDYIIKNYFYSGKLSYKRFKKLENINSFNFIMEGVQIFDSYKKAVDYRKKLEYDFLEYTLQCFETISKRTSVFNRYHDNIKQLKQSINRQRISEILKT